VKLLLINANTSVAITDLVAREARASALPGTEILAVTSDFGPRIISSRTENAIAMHASVDLAARHHEGCDAVVIAVSLDTGLSAVRELLSIPVVGMTEAALHTACMLGARFGLISVGARMAPVYRELVESHGLERRLAGIIIIDVEAHEAYQQPERAGGLLLAAMQELAERHDAEAVVLAGAALTGLARKLQPSVAFPVLDGVACAVHQAELLVRLGTTTSHTKCVHGRESVGLSEGLAGLLRGRSE
jgi:allantoin racemase